MGLYNKELTWFEIYPTLEAAERLVPLNGSVGVKAGGRKLCVARTAKGLYAVEDRCPHQGQPISGGVCDEENHLVCPFHRFGFDLESGQGHGMSLDTYPVEVRDDGVFVGVVKGTWNLPI